jgi:hypothetical protein
VEAGTEARGAGAVPGSGAVPGTARGGARVRGSNWHREA